MSHPTAATMPLLTAIDEYDSALTAIAIHAELAVESSEPARLEAALRSILVLCHQADEIVKDALSYATNACDSTPVAYSQVL